MSPPNTTIATTIGRPRDRSIDAAVAAATRELLEEVGYPQLTIPMVAARAGTSPPSVYRRWPTRVELVYDVMFPSGDAIDLPHTDDLDADIRSIARQVVAIFESRGTRTALSGLLAEFAAKPGLSASLLSRSQDAMYEQLQQRLDQEAAAGRIMPVLDARSLLDTLSGAALMALANERVVDQGWVDRLVEVVMRGISAATVHDGAST